MTIGSTINAYRASEGFGAQKRQGFSRQAEGSEPNEAEPDVLLDISDSGKQQSADKMKGGSGAGSSSKGGVEEEHTPEEQEQIEKLKARDAEVRAHEAAHMAAAGQYAKGGASYTYQQGPDGKQYAIGGEVQIDTSPIPGDPEATVRKMRQIMSAAHAPANPSGADHAVAASAAQKASEAQAEQAKGKAEGKKSGEPDKSATTSTTGATSDTGAAQTPKKVTSSATTAAYSASMHSGGSCTCKTCATYIPGPGISLAA